MSWHKKYFFCTNDNGHQSALYNTQSTAHRMDDLYNFTVDVKLMFLH